MQEFCRDKAEAFYCAEEKDGLKCFGADLHFSVKVILLYGGETKVWVENKSAQIAEAGDAVIIFPNQKYRLETQKKEEYILLVADIRRLSELLGVLSSYSPVSNVVKGAAKNAELEAIAKNTVRTYAEDKSEYRDTVMKGYVTALLGKLFSMAELKKNELERIDTLSEIMSYCNLHFRENLSLEILESELHISKYYISHVINEKLGEGFNEYLNSIRINEACRLLLESDMSIKEISAQTGFGTVRSFDRAFKRQKGETAREFRQRNFEKIKKE